MVEKKDSKIKKVTKKVTPKAKQEPVEPQFFAKDLVVKEKSIIFAAEFNE